MKYLALLVLIFGFIHLNQSDEIAEQFQDLPKSVLEPVRHHDDYLDITWNPIEDKNSSIVGFKAKFWKVDTVTGRFIDGYSNQLVEWEYTPLDEISLNAKPEVVIVGANETKASLNFKDQVLYIIKVQAYNEKGDGPYSNTRGIKIGL